MNQPMSTQERRERIEILGTLLDKAVATNSFFISAGYGTFFGIWAIARNDLSAGLQLFAGLWLIVSAATFAAWHLVGMTTTAFAVMRIADEEEGRARSIRVAIHEAGAKLVREWWLRVMIFTIVTAAMGVGTLAFGMLRALLCK